MLSDAPTAPPARPAEARRRSEHDPAVRIERLERRLEREHAARLEAEAIAEAGMRSLYQANAELDRRVAQRTAQLARALEDALVADRAKATFLSNLGHEVATPLHTVMGMLELIDTSALCADDRQRIAEASDAAERLRATLLGLLELSRAEGTPSRVSERQPEEVADEIAARWRGVALGRAQLLLTQVEDLRTEGARGVEADWERVERIADVLIDNAVRFAEPGRVMVTLRCGPDSVLLEVADEGPGIPEEHREHVLRPFVQLDDGHARKGGAGIGLSVAHRLATGTGGHLHIGTNGERGTRVLATVSH